MNYIFWLLVGFVLGAIYICFSRSLNIHGERNNLANGLVIAAIIYIGFAVVWGNFNWVGIEFLGVIAYAFIAWLGKKYHFIWVGIGWGLHPIWDILLHLWGPGVNIAPAWYAIACISFDGLLALYILFSLKRLQPKTK